MTKVLFLLSAVVMVVAGFFSYQNRETFIQTRKDRTEAVAKLKVEMKRVADLNNEIGSVREKIGGINTEVGTATERVAVEKNKLKQAEAESVALSKQMEEAQGKIDAYKKQIKDMPENVTIETMNEDINKLKQAIAESDSEVAKIKEQMEAKEEEVKKAQSKLNAVVEKIEWRKKLFDNNSMSATVVAVNNDWGFVVIDGGENKGIKLDTKLLVTRGQEPIGRLSIIDVKGNRTLANIEQKSIRAGVAVSPGDKVILESLYQ